MKKILIISEAFWSQSKGTAKYSLSLINKLKHKTDLHILVPRFNDGSEFLINGVTVHCVDVDIDSTIGLLDKKQRNRFCDFVGNNVKKISDKYGISLIHVIYGHFVIKSIPKNIGIPVVWTCHNMPPNESHPPFSGTSIVPQIGNRIYRSLVRLKHSYLINSSYITSIISISESTKRDIRDWIFSKSISVIGNGCSFETVKAKEKNIAKLNLITVGGVKPHKNLHLIPEISARLNVLGIEHNWLIVGPVMNVKYAKLLYEKISLNDCKVRYLGKVDQITLNRLYSESNLYVHLSREEGFCLTILEAAAHGVPSIATNVGAIPEIIRSLNNGLIVEPDIDSITSAIVKFNEVYFNFTNGMSLAQGVSEQWGWDSVSEKHIEFYSNLNCSNNVFNSVNTSYEN